MPYGLLADLVFLAHAGFVLFVMLGGLLAWHRPGVAWWHLPALAWGVVVEIAGWTCPLTPLENRLLRLAGESGYSDGFVVQLLQPLLYPVGLTAGLQWWLAGLAVVVNVLVYAVLFRKRRGK